MDYSRFQEAKNYKGILQIGQCVYSGLYGGRYGVIFKIHGKQDPDSIEHMLGGVVSMGGSAEYDIVFTNGNQSRRLPECILRGVQWRISDEIVSEDEIQRLLVHSHNEAELKVLAENKKREEHEEMMEKIKEENPHLTQLGASKRDPATRNLKKELKIAFPGVKFSVRADYNSINVDIVEGVVETKEVEMIAKKYQTGSFNGMIDLYEYDDNPWSDVFGGRKYVFVQNRVKQTV